MRERIKIVFQRFSGLAAIFLIGVSVFFAGMAMMYWVSRGERMQLVNRFPQVRASAAASATEAADAKYRIEISGLKSENEALRKSQELIAKSVQDTHDIAVDTRRFLGDRAKVNDQRQASMMRQTRETTQRIEVVAQKTAVVEQKATVAASKADEAANTAKAVDKKLETAVQPPLPAKPWIGTRR